MSDERLSRIENRVDEVKDEVSELKANSKFTSEKIDLLTVKMEENTELVSTHIAGDLKIINKIQPMMEDYSYMKERNKRGMAFLKLWSLRLGLISAIIGLGYSMSDVFRYFLSFLDL